MKPESLIPNVETIDTPPKGSIAESEGVIVKSPELGIEAGAEKLERKADINAIRGDIGLASVIPTPVVSVNDDTNTTVITNPIIASDDDLIEKEWVDKAKKIVAETQNDPYLREKEVSKLQVDYIKKRFGRELGVVDQ